MCNPVTDLNNMKIKLSFIFFWTLGITGLCFLIKVIATGGEGVILTNFQNPLIRYSLVVFGVNLSIVLLSIPVLMYRGIITADYYNADKYVQAKANFIVLTISAPGWIFLSIAAYYLAASRKALFILGIILLFVYISSIITLLKHKS
jgi:hypothetical protein